MFLLTDKDKASKGFSLIEAMVATAVLGFGLMAIATFHTKLVSGSSENKARLEALALAEEKIEEFRAETNQEDFDDLLVSGSDPDNPIEGTNAEYTRSWQVDQTDNYYDLAVTVAWSGRTGEPDSVALSTTLTFEDPTLGAQPAEGDRGPSVPSPTGRAILGGDEPAGDIEVEHEDGMREAFSGDDRQLVDGDGNVVLTLQEACNVDGICSEFVKISGTIYFDSNNLGNNYDYDEVFVIASDAAYCNRYVVDDSGNEPSTYFLSQYLESNSLPATPGDDYKFYNYTCYLGGGWNGNIGIVMNNPSQRDKACLGDPSYAIGTPHGPEIATRRAYRGMIYVKDENGDKAIHEETGLPLYRTIGIRDGAALPETEDEPPVYPGHDFVVTDLGPNATAVDCIESNQGGGPLTRGDSRADTPSMTDESLPFGTLFGGVPGDFVCLNPDNITDYNEQIYGEDGCPYKPTDPPARAHTLTAEVEIEEVRSAEELDYFRIKTSDTTWDMQSTCTQLSSSDTETGDGRFTRAMTYECLFFTWNDENNDPIGWNGNVEVSFRDDNNEPVDLDISCDPSIVSFNGAENDVSAELSCYDGYQSNLMAENLNGVQGNRRLDNVTITASIPGDQKTEPECSWTDSSFYCSTGIYINASEQWNGQIDVDSNSGNICPVNERSGQGWEILTLDNGSARISISDWPATSDLDLTGQLEIRNQSCL